MFTYITTNQKSMIISNTYKDQEKPTILTYHVASHLSICNESGKYLHLPFKPSVET